MHLIQLATAITTLVLVKRNFAESIRHERLSFDS